MKVIFIGDVVGDSGQHAIETYLPQLKAKYKPQLTIVNGENIAKGRGITEKLYKWLLSNGADVVTLGNHAFDQFEFSDFADTANALVRPVNLPATTAGKGVHYVKVNQSEVAIINALGSVFMGSNIDPFYYLADLIDEVTERTPHIIIDFHAETTSEKQAMGYWLDGRVSAVLGTHTHVQTNDAHILPKGTGYMTDVGMTGSWESIIGFKHSDAVKKFLTQTPLRLEPETKGPYVIQGAFLELDNQSGRTTMIEPIQITSHQAMRQRGRRFE